MDIISRATRSARKTAAALLLGGSVFCSFDAHADTDVLFANIGWWEIRYLEVGVTNGCVAYSRFKDQTTVSLALIQLEPNNNVWRVEIFNPQWVSWVRKRTQHTLRFLAAKPWYGTFFVTDDNGLYSNGVSDDFVNSLADAKSLAIATENKTVVATLDMKDSTPAVLAVVNCVRQHPNLPKAEVAISGTGFFVASNSLVTNNHVVKECTKPIRVRYPESSSYSATISGQDDTNDLALLRTDMKNDLIASLRSQVRLGETVAVYGFPYSDILSSSGNFTLGNVTSLTGMKDDTRLLQISTPVQPGNSGGPLLDMSGRVVGVVVGVLKNMPDSIPQNVNFAIRTSIVANFLDTKAITVVAGNAKAELPPTEVAEIAKGFTVQVFCGDISPKVSSSSSRSYFMGVKADGEMGDLSPAPDNLPDGNWGNMNFFQ